jgi:hypothetical protein
MTAIVFPYKSYGDSFPTASSRQYEYRYGRETEPTPVYKSIIGFTRLIEKLSSSKEKQAGAQPTAV